MLKNNSKTLHVREIRISAPSEDAAFEAFSPFGTDFTLTKRPKSSGMTVKFYRESAEELDEIGRRLRDNAELLKDCGIRIIWTRTSKLQKEDWSEKWKRHFKVLKVGRHLVVKPSWLDHRRRQGDLILELDPGMSFGTGKHETTRFCLNEIERARRQNKKQSFLDAGCGSGILSIAACRLGYSPVVAFDNDPEAVETALENMRRNALSETDAKLACVGLEKARNIGHFDVVAANIISTALIQNKEVLGRLTADNGLMILAGIPDADAREVLSAFSGFSLLRRKSRQGWTGLVMRKE